jgi:hypothetical protein
MLIMPVQLINGSFPDLTIIVLWGDLLGMNLQMFQFHSYRSETDEWKKLCMSRTRYRTMAPVCICTAFAKLDRCYGWCTQYTQCPIAPGDSFTYGWRAAEYGTGWYHSHFFVQAWAGDFGGIQINGPATANYDIDLGHVFLNDWYHVSQISKGNRTWLAKQ